MKEKSPLSYLVALVIISVAILTCHSCNKTEDAPTLKRNELENLLFKVQNLTEEQIKENGVSTRFSFWRWFTFACADACGYLLSGGNLGVGVSSSSLAWTVMKDYSSELRSSETDSTEEDSIIPKDERDDEWLDPTCPGYAHNDIIDRVYQENGGEEFFNLDEEQQVRIICEYTEKFKKESDPSYSITESEIEETIRHSKKISEKLSPTMTVREYADALKSTTENEDYSYGIEIIASVVHGLENSDSNQVEYLKEIVDAINESDISQDIKTSLIESLSIAHASSVIWNSGS